MEQLTLYDIIKLYRYNSIKPRLKFVFVVKYNELSQELYDLNIVINANETRLKAA